VNDDASNDRPRIVQLNDTLGESAEATPITTPLAVGAETDTATLRGAVSAWPRDGGDDPRARAIAQARRLMANDRAESSRDKYARCWAAFVRFVAEREPNHVALPAHPALVGLYAGAMTDRGCSKKTILVHLAAITYAHDLTGSPAPSTRSADLKRQIRGIRREDESDRPQRAAIERERAAEILGILGQPTKPIEVRDYAMFCLGWLTALRRSNIAALRIRDVNLRRDSLDGRRYLDILIRKSKTDQEAKGRNIAIPELPGAHPLCAVRAIERWLDVATLGDNLLRDDANAPLFPSFSLSRSESGREITGRFIAGEDVRRILRRLLARAGVNPDTYSPHSLRHGFATTMQDAGIPDAVAMEMGGWKDRATYHGYNRVDKARRNAVRDLFG